MSQLDLDPSHALSYGPSKLHRIPTYTCRPFLDKTPTSKCYVVAYSCRIIASSELKNWQRVETRYRFDNVCISWQPGRHAFTLHYRSIARTENDREQRPPPTAQHEVSGIREQREGQGPPRSDRGFSSSQEVAQRDSPASRVGALRTCTEKPWSLESQ